MANVAKIIDSDNEGKLIYSAVSPDKYARVRSTPFAEANEKNVIGKVYGGSSIGIATGKITDDTLYWVEVNYNGEKGWVRSDIISFSRPEKVAGNLVTNNFYTAPKDLLGNSETGDGKDAKRKKLLTTLTIIATVIAIAVGIFQLGRYLKKKKAAKSATKK